ncbi:MAG: NACHT domain-containing protein [Caldilineaceae bacterium]
MLNYQKEPDQVLELRQRYLRRLLHTCNSLPLALIGGDEESAARITLDQVYIELYTRTFEEPNPKVERKGGVIADARANQKPLSALEVATRHPRLVLLGDPGSGKSTFVQKMAGWVAGAALGENLPPLPTGWDVTLLPIFTVLRELAPKLSNLNLSGLDENERDKRLLQTLFAHWQEELENDQCGKFYSTLRQAVVEGKVFLVFDGLDEVPQQTRVLVRQSVTALLHQYRTIQRVIITCRIRSYVGNAVLPGWPDHRLAPFEAEQVQRFVAAWYNTQYKVGRFAASANVMRRLPTYNKRCAGRTGRTGCQPDVADDDGADPSARSASAQLTSQVLQAGSGNSVTTLESRRI